MSRVVSEVYDLCLAAGTVAQVGARHHLDVPDGQDPVVVVRQQDVGATGLVHSTSWRWDGVLLVTWVRCLRGPRTVDVHPVDKDDRVVVHALRHLAWLARRDEPGLSEPWRAALTGYDESPAGRLDA